MSKGELLYKKFQCHICHGEDAASPERMAYPVIARQNKSYLIQQLIDIRDGVRDNGQTRLMRPVVQSLTDVEVEAIAHYLSTMDDQS